MRGGGRIVILVQEDMQTLPLHALLLAARVLMAERTVGKPKKACSVGCLNVGETEFHV